MALFYKFIKKNKTTLLVMLGIAIFFIALLTIVNQKVRNDEVCGVDVYNYQEGVTQEGYFINDNSTYYLTKFSLPNNKVPYQAGVDICTMVNISTSEGLTINLIDSSENVLGVSYQVSMNGELCIYTNESIGKGRFLGLQCEDCDETNTLALYKDFSGDDTLIKTFDGVIFNSTPVVSMKSYISCDEFKKKNVGWFVLTMALLFMVLLIIIGIEKFEEMATKW